MNSEDDKIIAEHLKLQREFREYIDKNGFDYGEYCSAPPGSFYEKYRKRFKEISEVVAPELKYHVAKKKK